MAAIARDRRRHPYATPLTIVAGAAGAGLIGLAASPGAPGALLYLFGGLLVAAVFMLILVRHFDVAVLVLLATRSSLDVIGDVKLGPLNVAAVLALLLIAACVLHLASERRSVRTTDVLFPYILFLAVAAATILITPNLVGGIRDWLRFASLAAVFVFVAEIARTDEGARKVCLAIVLSAILPILVGLVQYLTGQGFVIKQGEFTRIMGTFKHPNPFALYIVIIFPLVFAVFATMPSWRWFVGPVMGGLAVCLVLSFTRTGWIGLAISLLVIAWLRFRKWLLVAPIIVAVILFAVPTIGERFADLGEDDADMTAVTPTNSLDWRVDYWRQALNKLTASPIAPFVGTGINSVLATTEESKAPHNDYVRVLVETGVVGGILFLWAMGRLLRRSYMATRAPASRFRQMLRVGFFGSCVAFLLMSATSNLISQPALQWYLWAFAAIALSGPGLDERGRPVPVEDDTEVDAPILAPAAV